MLRIAALVFLSACLVPVHHDGYVQTTQWGTVSQPIYVRPAYAQRADRASCEMGSDGVQACGYGCMIGADGVAACANAPGGACSMGSDGHVYCSQAPAYAPTGGARATCELNSDGTQSCGYHCELGSDGHHYCASAPNGTCGLNSDGTYTCS